jgi:hypothetical protein
MKFTINKYTAEIAGIFAADGSMQQEHLSLWGNIVEDRDYYDIVLNHLFQVSFGITVNPHSKKSNRVYGFYVCKKDILDFFKEEFGFKPGCKTYTVRVPSSVMNSADSLVWSAFIRGFCDGDGSLSFGLRYGKCKPIYKIIHTYPRIQLKSVSPSIIYDISILLGRLNIPHITCVLKATRDNESDSHMIQISGKERLAVWMDRIGFNNPVAFTRYEIFKNHGFVPPNTSIAQRYAVLEGELNPISFYPNGPVA